MRCETDLDVGADGVGGAAAGPRGRLARHCRVVRLVHWTAAVSTFVLVVSGMFQLPLAKRYFIHQVPGLAWSGDFGFTLVVHYLAAAALVFAATLHVAYHGARRDRAILPRRGDVRESIHIVKAMLGFGEEPPSHKFLAEQRLAYAYLAASLGLVIATGTVKVVKNLPGVELPATLLAASTHLHNLAMVLVLLGIAGHLAAFLVPANRALVPSMFTGRVDEAYARRRHGLWVRELEPDRAAGSAREPERREGAAERPSSSTPV